MTPPPCRKCKSYCFFGDTPCPETEDDLRHRIWGLEGALGDALEISGRSLQREKDLRIRVRELAARLPRTVETAAVIDELLALGPR